jgi:hypothetical protein
MGTVSILRPYPPAATLRDMARARWREAVLCLEAGDYDGWASRMRDVERLTDQARLARAHEEHCRATARALDRLLELAERHAPRDAG